MANNLFSDRLLEVQLFQGISKADLQEIVGKTRFDFSKHASGQTIVKEYEPCEHLLFLLNGEVEVTTVSADHTYRVTEYLSAPLQLQPERLFGRNQHYTSTYKAHTQCNIMSISKREVMKLFHGYEVCRLNLINLLANSLQHQKNAVWSATDETLTNRIIQFMKRHCQHPTGRKVFKMKMTDLAHEVNDSRLDVSRALNEMQKQGLIILTRGIITIPAIEELRAKS